MSDAPVGLQIKRARERKRWTQRRLADEIGGVSFKTVGNWERGKSFPRNAVGRIEEVLGISLTGSGGEPDPEEEALRALGTERGGFLKPDEVDWILSVYRLRKRPRAG